MYHVYYHPTEGGEEQSLPAILYAANAKERCEQFCQSFLDTNKGVPCTLFIQRVEVFPVGRTVQAYKGTE